MVAKQVTLGDGSLAVPTGKEHLVEVRDADLATIDDPRALLLDSVERGDLGVGGGHGAIGMLPFGRRRRRRGGNRALAPHVPRRLVRLDALVRGLAQQVVGSPLGKLDADDDLRLDPPGSLQPRGRIQWRLGPLDGLEPLPQTSPRPRVEATADLPGVRPSVPAAHRENERAEVGVAALSRQPAHHDDLLLAANLELEPRAAATIRLVRRVPQLGDDPFELLLASRLEEGGAFGHDVAREPDECMRPEAGLEHALAFLERDPQERLPIEMEQVERLVHDRGRLPLAPAARGAPGADAGPVLEQAEPRAAGLVQRDDLTVDDRFLRLDPVRRRRPAAGSNGPRPGDCASTAARCPPRTTASTR